MNTWSRCAGGARRRWSARRCSTPCSRARTRPPRQRRSFLRGMLGGRVTERRVRGAAARGRRGARPRRQVDQPPRADPRRADPRPQLRRQPLAGRRRRRHRARAAASAAASVRPFGDGRVSLDGAGPGRRACAARATPLDCANSGTTMRLMAGVLAAHDRARRP